ncbi:SET and MYND domain-containing protein 4-like [Zerene cesonia]|uniref:SET and MYND domain-containing protein 4-like n=1 Tax=Zerene cesonia TaxID=33412 RepID=UPI0018E597D5|nr:SET and MYND domain-containing protein 4-like [Zerene cesonia]
MSRIYDGVDSTYAEACSDVTLCCNKKGFFKNFAEEIVSIAESNDWLETFERVADGNKVAAVMENEAIRNTIREVFARIQPLHRGKDARVSHEKRLAAQAAIESGDMTKAFAMASQAVLRAPMTGVDDVIDGGVSLALALWVRSEVLLKTNKHFAALEDLKLALKERLPAKMRAQYYWRMGHCYKGAKEPTRAKVSYELAGRLLGNNETATAQQELQADIASLDYTMKPSQTLNKTGVQLTGGGKLNIPALSNLVKITEEEEKGRFVVAKDLIKTGDVLLVDSPYAACLMSDYYGSHCLHCFKRLENSEVSAPIWCPKCSAITFCSVECRDVAVATYHPHECQFLDLFIGSGMSILSHIALRMVTQAGLDTSLQIHSTYIKNGAKSVEGTILNDIEGSKKSRLKSRKERLNRSKKYLKSFDDKNAIDETKEVNEKTNGNDTLELAAGQIYSLCTHSQLRKGSDYLKRVVMAMFLTECLKKGGFFSKLHKEAASQAESSVCELLLHNLQLLQFNAHEIYETVRGDHQFAGSKPVYIAVGIYPTGALFNHECYPAVARYFEGRKIVLRATRPLNPGDTVSENYGPHFLVRSLKERRRSLACRYWFNCQCVACKEDWPMLKQMNNITYLRCPNIACNSKFLANPKCLPNKCSKCSVPIDPKLIKIYLNNIDDCSSLYQEGAKLMDEENPQEAISKLCKGVDLFHEVAKPPHKDTHLAQESLRSCYATFGNVYVVSGKPT